VRNGDEQPAIPGEDPPPAADGNTPAWGHDAKRRWIAEQLARAPEPTPMTVSIIVAILTEPTDDDQAGDVTE
jgi:hypothetical protein